MLKGSSLSALLIPGLHYSMCNGKFFWFMCRLSHRWLRHRLLNAVTNQLPLTDSHKAACYSMRTMTPLLSLYAFPAPSAAKGDNLEKGNPKDMIIRGYFSVHFFNDLFSRVIPADIEISYNFQPL